MNFFRKKLTVDINFEELLDKVQNKNFIRRYFMLIFGLFLGAFGFNLFYAPYNIVTGGTTGIALIVRKFFDISPSDFVLISSFVLLIFSFIFLGAKTTIRTTVGVIILPFFMKATENVVNVIDLENTSMIVMAIFGGLLSGFSSGLVFKAGFSSGGSQIINQIMVKYLKMSMGNASLILNAVIIAAGSFVFGVPNALYAVLSLYISSVITDKVLLGISSSKAFYIITSKEKEVSEFIIKELNHSVTIVDAKGGYSNDKVKMLMTVIPTREYFKTKEVILSLDENAFFLVVDGYEFQGGTLKQTQV